MIIHHKAVASKCQSEKQSYLNCKSKDSDLLLNYNKDCLEDAKNVFHFFIFNYLVAFLFRKTFKRKTTLYEALQ